MTKPLTVWLPVGLGMAAFALFAGTAARTITFWDGAHYPLLATTLSITNPPGSLLLTLLGWAWTRVVWCSSTAFQLNLLAAALAAGTVALIARVTMRAVAGTEQDPVPGWAAGLLAAGWLATSFHLWTYATQFTPYILTAAFTALLLFLFLRWWERAEDRDDAAGLMLFAFVLGLDVSVHRTNQLLLPAFLASALLRRPRLFLNPGACGLAALAYAAGVASQLGYLVLSARRPFLDLAEMSSISDVWHFVRLDPLGGGFRVNLWPRHADFWRVQLADWLAFLWRSSGATGLSRTAALVLACLGLVELTRRSRPKALLLLMCFVSAGLGAVIYFNRPEQYMRPLDRHYMPSLVVSAVFVGVGASWLASLVRAHRSRIVRMAPALGLCVLLVSNLVGNFSICDRSHTRIAERWARDLLEPLPANAILFTNGDNDSFPPWYLQQAEHVRPDVLVLNLPILCLPSGVQRLAARDAAFRSVQPGMQAMRAVMLANAGRRPVYAAMTVDPAWEPDARKLAILEGVSSRLYLEGEMPVSGPELERFVAERVPLLGVDDPRQLLEPEMQQMLTNYLWAGIQLAGQQFGHKEYARGLATLRMLEGRLPPARLGEPGKPFESQIARMRHAAEEAQRKPAAPAGS